MQDAQATAVHDALMSAHQAVAELKGYVEARHRAMINDERRRAADVSATPPTEEGSDPSHCSAADLFDDFMLLVRSTVTAAVNGTLPPTVPASAVGTAGAVRARDDEAARLRALLRSVVAELDAERADKASAAADLRTFNNTLAGYRDENAVLHVYRDRIMDLQGVIGGTKRPWDVRQEIGPRGSPNTSSGAGTSGGGAALTLEQRRAEVANELARLTVIMKEKHDRAKADAIKAAGERTLLQAENTMLADRVRVLEAQLSVVAASSSVAMRELQRQRVANAYDAEALISLGGVSVGAAASAAAARQQQGSRNGGTRSATPASQSTFAAVAPHPAKHAVAASPPPGATATVAQRNTGRKLRPGECIVGGIVMEHTVANWLRDMYVALLEDPEGVSQLLALPSPPDASGSAFPAVAAASVNAAASSVVRPGSRNGRAPTAGGGATGGLSRPASHASSRGEFKAYVRNLRGERGDDNATPQTPDSAAMA